MKITKREILASITIIAVMFLIGSLISGRIESFQIQKNSEYYQAAKITDSEMFQYGMHTDLGNAFVYGDLQALDPVTYPEIGGAYLYVEKVEEHYNMHTRTVAYTDSKGKTQTRTETYWSWDYVGSEDIHSKKIRFCGIEMDANKICDPPKDYIDTINESGFVRFVYSGCEAEYTGTVYTDLRDGAISDDSPIYVDQTIEETVDYLTHTFIWIFWIIWILITGGVIFGFYYLDNTWLE